MKAWRVHQHGSPTQALELDEIDSPLPGPGQVRIAVSHTVLNFNDIDGCYGRYQTVNPTLPYVAGMEVVGTVDEAGEGAESLLGHRVMATPDGAVGGYAEHAIAGVDMVFDVPDALSGIDAAAFFYPFHLSYLALHERARIQSGETVLIHAAAGGIGSAAVQVAKAAGARVVTTAGSAAKVAFCEKLGADVALNYSDQDFAAEVMEATSGVGVDVVFDTVGGDVAEKTWGCIARNGRHVMVGFSSGIGVEDNSLTPRPIMFGNFAVLGVLLAYSTQPEAIKRATGWNLTPKSVGDEVHAALTVLLGEGAIHPIVGNVVPFADIPSALEVFESRQTVGRTVVEL